MKKLIKQSTKCFTEKSKHIKEQDKESEQSEKGCHPLSGMKVFIIFTEPHCLSKCS